MSGKFKWWGYVHTNGSIQVKRYSDERDIDDALESPFVERIIRPFEASGRQEALSYISNLIK